jgi:hypothetical protein
MADWDREFPAPEAEGQGAVRPARRIRFADPERHETSLVLEHPLDIESERLDRLTIRRITAAEMLTIVESPEAPSDDAELTRAVVAAMAGIDRDVLDALSPDDAGRVAAAALPFMPAGLVAALERAGEAMTAENPVAPG